jgi:hypothetical protein
MINRSTFDSIWQSKLAQRGAMFTGACLLTLVPICSSSAFTTFTDSPKAIVCAAIVLQGDYSPDI